MAGKHAGTTVSSDPQLVGEACEISVLVNNKEVVAL